jgi:hypothetical protein
MSRKRTNEELDSFDIDLSLFDGPSDKIVNKIPRKPMPTPKEAANKIFGTSGLGATYEGPNDDNKYLDKVIYEASADGRLQTMPEIISDAPNYPAPQGKGGASRKMRRPRKTRKSRRMRRIKSQMRRKNSSRKSTRRRTRK